MSKYGRTVLSVLDTPTGDEEHEIVTVGGGNDKDEQLERAAAVVDGGVINMPDACERDDPPGFT